MFTEGDKAAGCVSPRICVCLSVSPNCYTAWHGGGRWRRLVRRDAVVSVGDNAASLTPHRSLLPPASSLARPRRHTQGKYNAGPELLRE